MYAGASELEIEPVAGFGGEELLRSVLVLGVARDVPPVELLALLALEGAEAAELLVALALVELAEVATAVPFARVPWMGVRERCDGASERCCPLLLGGWYEPVFSTRRWHMRVISIETMYTIYREIYVRRC
jgi:hypothetical protein